MKKIILPLLVLAVGFGLGKFMLATGPAAEKAPQEQRPTVVEVKPLSPQSYPVNITASGIVRPHTQTNLVAEVAGKVLEISPNFQAGSYFNKGEVLVKLDDSNYQNAVTIAEGELAQKQLALREQQAQAELAQRDWRLLENSQNRQQSDLAARRPHLAAAEAAIQAATAKLQQEKLNLARTAIAAPYAGRALEKRVDIGQYVTPGTVLGVVYATDAVEVHLPLSLAQYELLDMPESFRDKATSKANLPSVAFRAHNGKDVWYGKIVRSSAALDEKSRQISVIARIERPFEAQASHNAPLRIGQYLTASIAGKTFEGVYVVPNAAVRQGKEILLLRDGKVAVQPVRVIWNAEQETVVTADVDLNGQQVIVTPLPLAVDGQMVKVAGVPATGKSAP